MGKRNGGDPELPGEGPPKKNSRQFIYHRVRHEMWHSWWNTVEAANMRRSLAPKGQMMMTMNRSLCTIRWLGEGSLRS